MINECGVKTGPVEVSIPEIKFIQAKNFTPVAGYARDVRWVVIHTAELVEKPNSAENLAKWSAGATAPRASWHYAVDNNSITQSVHERDVAWHAPGANRHGIGIEHAGFARQSHEDWEDNYSASMLHLSSRLVAKICARQGIPVKYIDFKDLRNGEPGITGHYQVSLAFGKSTHTDPGVHFPWYNYIRMIKGFYELDALYKRVREGKVVI